jgi:hypothetical protein
MLDDMIPEEGEEQYKKLIPLLRRGFRDPVTISSPESSQIIAQVRERLMQADYHSSENEKISVQQPGQITTSGPLTSVRTQQKARIPRFINVLAAVLVVGLLIGTSLLLFRPHPHSPAATPIIASTGPTAHAQVNGLEASIHLVTPGPYFLSELLLVDLSLTNRKQTLLTLNGRNQPDNFCSSSVITALITGKDAPSYSFPSLDFVCNQPAFITELMSGHTLTLRQYLPVTKNGEVMITMGTTRYQPPDPLNGHGPSLHIHVAPRVPSGRMISLHAQGAQGAQVMVQAPQAALAHLLYMQSITCDNYGGLGLFSWTSLTTTILSQPACPTAHKQWTYIVSAPGYPIVSGSQSSSISSIKDQ